VGFMIPILWIAKEKNDPLVTLERIRDEVFIAGDLEINLTKRQVRRRGQAVELTKTEYELLSCLVRNNGKVMRHEELLQCVWGPVYGQEKEYLHTYVAQLRRKIQDNHSSPRLIQTVPGFGYRFVEAHVLQPRGGENQLANELKTSS
jgi:DNA-binding response OmpR family regulator